ncbi:MAG: OsmC family protein [Euryarchaeota archaeon]|nr:OsmC family protein [Euryarchaeota archaeon]
MNMEIRFPGGKKVEATYKGYTTLTDQPTHAGGNGSALEPFSLFLVSIGTCTGFYVLSFCQKHDIPTKDISLVLTTEQNDETHLITNITIDIKVPKEFPEQYKNAVIKAAESCAVKKQLDHPPQFTIHVI